MSAEASRGDASSVWTALAPAKINLGLFVGPLRRDGRHELVTVMQSISLADELTLERAPAASGRDEVLCPGVSGENLAARALALFREATGWREPPMRLRIHKRVPVAAGLGGGSGDAAAALRLASAASGLGDQALLLDLAQELGADVPAQVSPGRWLATGAGERLEKLASPSADFGVLVLASDAGLSTAQVYAQADRLGAARETAQLQRAAGELRAALATGAGGLPDDPALLHNDLAQAAIALCPAVGQALEQARCSGADHVLVSGSGPTAIGLFGFPEGVRRAQAAASALGGRTPAAVHATPVDERFARAHRPSIRNNAVPVDL